MVTPIALPAHARLEAHRIAAPRPVELARSPGTESLPASAGAGANPPPPGPLVAGATFGQLLQIDPKWSGDAQAFAVARAAGAYGLASMPETVALAPTAPRLAYEEASGVGFIPGEIFMSGDAGKLRDYLRGEVAASREAARREQAISDRTGVEARLAYDPNTGDGVVLFPGDAGYADVEGARAMFDRTARDLQKMGQSHRDYADLLEL